MTVELLHVDCMEYMRDCPDNAFDLAIVDPPYGIGTDLAKNKSRSKRALAKDYKPFHGSDINPPNKEYFFELQRISKNQILWGANHYLSRVAIDSSCWIVWDKMNGKNDFADCELAWTSFSSAVRKFTYKWHGMLQQDMKNKETRIHPTQKPMQLYRWILENYSKPGQRILDTHLGSGSSAIAAHYYGVDFVGCEIDGDYYNAACERFDNETKQLAMF